MSVGVYVFIDGIGRRGEDECDEQFLFSTCVSQHSTHKGSTVSSPPPAPPFSSHTPHSHARVRTRALLYLDTAPAALHRHSLNRRGVDGLACRLPHDVGAVVAFEEAGVVPTGMCGCVVCVGVGWEIKCMLGEICECAGIGIGMSIEKQCHQVPSFYVPSPLHTMRDKRRNTHNKTYAEMPLASRKAWMATASALVQLPEK